MDPANEHAEALTLVIALSLFRWIHELAAISWFGEVFFITHILLPTFGKLSEPEKASLFVKLYPRVFRMATISSSVTIAAGTVTLLLITNFDLSTLPTTQWGLSLLIGAGIGLFMFLLHATVERVEVKVLNRARKQEPTVLTSELRVFERRLKLLPRIGFTLLTIALVLMIYASHGF